MANVVECLIQEADIGFQGKPAFQNILNNGGAEEILLAAFGFLQ